MKTKDDSAQYAVLGGDERAQRVHVMYVDMLSALSLGGRDMG